MMVYNDGYLFVTYSPNVFIFSYNEATTMTNLLAKFIYVSKLKDDLCYRILFSFYINELWTKMQIIDILVSKIKKSEYQRI